MLQRSDYHKLLRLLTPNESKDKAAQDDPPLAPVVQSAQTEAFLVSAAARLHEVQTRRPDNETPTASAPTQSVMGPQTHSLVKARTVVSPDGVLQNPLGRHEGKRVWGGGIVKVKKMEWIPWGIDRLVLAEDEHGLGDARASDTSALTLRVTEAARGSGLNSIQRVNWGDQVANIHTAAIPPWMVASEEEYRRCNQRNVNMEPTAPGVEHSSSTKPVRRDAPSKTLKPGARDIFDRLNPQYDEKTWLPNFGGVWQEGPRSKTKREFKKTVRQQVKPPSTLPEPAPLRSSMDNKPASVAPATTQETNQTPTAQVPSTDQLDAKKQLLLAQKERLRAKLAAKRKT
ncbi:hypothetical protein Poli38472_011267 [Pythium oligandrum]|uniref:Uncharacterized protein n=1 Tax=Pythium oligandrum TaxID=41045 RepID=A0A8K1CRZ2_PYTOL|nr:hypothetical protein Poli38472_011267 [Pythium oligandrum]|eukprot:TMW67647.1 hypothetical protein Poli38472_011267 [Pythium oligandrum]